MRTEFRNLYGDASAIRVFRAPGRVNLIGEHTDYNLGFVMPVALQLATYIATAPGSGGRLRIFSEDRKEMREFGVADLASASRTGEWTDYSIGVARELLRLGIPIPAADLLIRSTVPEGAGLSSSAALEVSSALAFLNGRPLPPLEVARLCQRAERDFVGLPCGIMDQYISAFGRENAAVQIDCRSLEHRDVQLPGEVTFVAVNTMVKHALSGSAYGDRVRECGQAVERLQAKFPSVASLRDVTPEMFAEGQDLLPDLIRKRARHVVTEDERVNRFVEASERGDVTAMGGLLVASHRSLQHDYEVSCAELDFLVDTALRIDGVFGSRMTGGGFGGCTVTMLRPDAVACFESEIAQAYERKFQVKPDIYPCKPSAGASEVQNFETIPPAM